MDDEIFEEELNEEEFKDAANAVANKYKANDQADDFDSRKHREEILKIAAANVTEQKQNVGRHF